MDPLYGQRSTYPKKEEKNDNWVLIDAYNQPLGRLASRIAHRLMGKDKANYQPGVDVGDNVVVINAAKIAATGSKMDKKMYYWHSGYMGGLKQRNLRTQLRRQPHKALEIAIKGMLPKNRYGRKLLTQVRIFPGEEHNLQAQKPTPVSFNLGKPGEKAS